MADKTMLVCHFIAEWGGSRINFSEVSGLDILIDTIDEREGGDKNFSEHKIPSLTKYTNVIMKRAIIEGDYDFYNWINTHDSNTIERRDVVIKLLDEKHAPVLVWKLIKAFPVRYSGPILNSQSDEIAMEELEVAHEGLLVVH